VKALPLETRALCQSLFAQGFTPPVISQKTGVRTATISRWAYVYQWVSSRDKAQAIQSEEEAKSIAERSAGVRDQLASAIERHARQFAEVPTKNGRHALALESKAEPLVRNAAKVFGWEPGQQTLNILAVQTLDDIEPEPEPEADPNL